MPPSSPRVEAPAYPEIPTPASKFNRALSDWIVPLDPSSRGLGPDSRQKDKKGHLCVHSTTVVLRLRLIAALA